MKRGALPRWATVSALLLGQVAVTTARADRHDGRANRVDSNAGDSDFRWPPDAFSEPTEPAARSESLRVNWRGLTLRRAIERLEAASGVVVFVDRRIDPDSPLSIDTSGDAGDLLASIAEESGGGVSTLAGVYYLGPRRSARSLQTLHARAVSRTANLSPVGRKRYRRLATLSWPHRTSPRDVAPLSELLAAGQAFRVPHDLWRAKQLPPARLSEQLTLLLVGFGLDWRPTGDGRRIEVEPISEPVALTAWHQPSRVEGWEPAAFLKNALGAQIDRRGDGWLVRGRYEDHRLFAGGPKGLTPRRHASAGPSSGASQRQRFTLQISEAPAAAILSRIAAALGLEFLDKTTNGETGRRISLAVEQASLRQLLTAVERAAEIELSIQGSRIVAASSGAGERPKPNP